MGGTARDEDARFLGLLRDYGTPLLRLCAAYAAGPEDREDLYQEICLALWRALPGFRGEASLRTWVYRIAHNVAGRHSARAGRRRRREAASDAVVDQPSHHADAESELLAGERRRVLLDLVRSLPLENRQIVLLHLEGLGHAEIEEVCGISAGAVATRLSRIRTRLREAVQKGGAG